MMTGIFLYVALEGVDAMERLIGLLSDYITIVLAISASRFNLLMSWGNSNEKRKVIFCGTAAVLFFFYLFLSKLFLICGTLFFCAENDHVMMKKRKIQAKTLVFANRVKGVTPLRSVRQRLTKKRR